MKCPDLKLDGQEAELAESMLIWECGDKGKQGNTTQEFRDYTEDSEFPWAVLWGFRPSLTRPPKGVPGGVPDIWNMLRLPGFVCFLQLKVNYE